MLPPHQRKDFGRYFLEKLEEEIIKKGFKKIRIGTTTLMEGAMAIGLYKKMGYKEVKRVYNPNAGFGENFASITFEKEIV